MSTSINIVPLSSQLSTVQKPKPYQQFSSRESVIQTMTRLPCKAVPYDNPLILIYAPDYVEGADIDTGIIAVVLFLDQASNGLYTLASDRKSFSESEDAPDDDAPGLDRYVFFFDPKMKLYTYIGLFQYWNNDGNTLNPQHTYLWKIKGF